MWSKSSYKLLQEAHVARVELPNVANAVLHHRDPLNSHAKREAGDLLRVISRLLFRCECEDRRVDHSTSEQLDPTGLLALPAALTCAEDAAYLHIGRGLRERKKRRKKARFHARPKERLHRVIQRSLKIAEGDVRVHAKALD